MGLIAKHIFHHTRIISLFEEKFTFKTDIINNVKHYYERYWQDQETLSDFSYKWPIIKKFIPTDKDIKILDFGCGKGAMFSEIAKINPSAALIGVDVSEKALKSARKKVQNHSFILVKEGEKLPFKENCFDFIIASDVLEHIYDTELAFKELCRVLKHNGKILISVPYYGLVKNIIIALFFFDYIYEPTTPHIRFFTKKHCLNV